MNDCEFKILKEIGEYKENKMINYNYTYDDIKEKTKDLLFKDKEIEHLNLFDKNKIYTYEEIIEILGVYYNVRSIRTELRSTF